jgi:hypothetical protein
MQTTILISAESPGAGKLAEASAKQAKGQALTVMQLDEFEAKYGKPVAEEAAEKKPKEKKEKAPKPAAEDKPKKAPKRKAEDEGAEAPKPKPAKVRGTAWERGARGC